MLEELKILLEMDADDASQDDLLEILISQVKSDIEKFCRVSYIDEMQGVAESMVVFRYNQIGMEGASNARFTGALYAPSSAYPDYILSQLRGFRRIGVVR